MDPIGKSDHVVLMFGFLCDYDTKSVTQLRYVYERGDYDSFTSELCGIEWEYVFAGLDINTM